jgi:hypothetical protein
MSRERYHYLSTQQLYLVRKHMTNAQGYLGAFEEARWGSEAKRFGMSAETLYNVVLRRAVIVSVF